MVNSFRIMADDVVLAEMTRVDVGDSPPAGAVAIHQMRLIPITEAIGALSAGDASALLRFLLTVAAARVDLNSIPEDMKAALFHLHGYTKPCMVDDVCGNISVAT